MEYNRLKSWQAVSETEVDYQIGSLYERFQHISDLGKRRCKRYRLHT